jgi:hypothetical protein
MPKRLNNLVNATNKETRPPLVGRRRRLLRWLAGRSILPVVLLLIALYSWHSGVLKSSSYHRLSRTSTATVENWFGSPSTNFFLKNVYNNLFAFVKYEAGSHAQEVLIAPLLRSNLVKGQHLRIRYDPNNPTDAAYAGSAGDWLYPDGIQQYEEALGILLLSIVISIFYASRLIRITGVAHSSQAARGRVTEGTGYVDPPPIVSALYRLVKADPRKYQYIRLERAGGGPKLEWRLLPGQPQVPETVLFHGHIGYRQWLVARLPDTRCLWPASRTEPVINIDALKVPCHDLSSRDLIKVQRQLLGAYAQILLGVKNLPFLIHRPPGNSRKAWWYIGVPKPVVRSLVKRHIRLHADALGAALTVAAVQNNMENEDELRKAMNEASQECAVIAGMMRPHISIGNVVTIIATGLGLVGLFYAFPHVHISSKNAFPALVPILLIISIFGLLPWTLYFRSVQYTKKLFKLNESATTTVDAGPEDISPNKTLSINEVEGMMFDETAILRPKTWHESSRVIWLVAIVYATIIGWYIYDRYGKTLTLIALVYVALVFSPYYIPKTLDIIKRIIAKAWWAINWTIKEVLGS